MGSLSAVINDLTLPSTQQGATVTWETSNALVITNTGEVTRPIIGASNITAQLTATVTFNGLTDTRVFDVTVAAKSNFYRYLKVIITDGTDMSIREIEWVTDAVTYPTAAIATATGSSTNGEKIADATTVQGYYNMYLAYNKALTANFFQGSATFPQQITLDLGVGKSIETQTLKITSDSWFIIKAFDVYGSYDNSSFKLLKSFSGLTATDYVVSGSNHTGTFDVTYTTPTTIYTTSWSAGEPTDETIAQIDGDYSGAGFTCNELNISASGSLSIAEGETVVVQKDITNAGDIAIMSGGSLVNQGSYTGAGAFTVIRNSSWADGVNRYSMISSPVMSADISSLGSSFHYDYNTSDDTWSAFSGTMVSGQGYTSAGKGALIFSGAPNSGDVPVSVSDAGNGYNLIGNPYTSAINYKEFVTENAASINGAIWLWDDGGSETGSADDGDYITVNSLGVAASGGGGLSSKTLNYDNTNLYLGVAQAFFVKVESGVSSLDFTGDMRVLGSTDDDNFFRTDDQKSIIKLSAITGSTTSNTIVGLTSDALLGYDAKYDAPALESNSKTTIYSFINDDRYAIQGLPAGDQVVKIEVNSAESTKIELSELTGLEGKNIVLVDVETGEATNLLEKSYNYTPTASGKKSFKLVIGEEAANVLNADKIINTSVNLSSQGINITGNKATFNASVLDITGRVLFDGKTSGFIKMPIEARKVYIIRVDNVSFKATMIK